MKYQVTVLHGSYARTYETNAANVNHAARLVLWKHERRGRYRCHVVNTDTLEGSEFAITRPLEPPGELE